MKFPNLVYAISLKRLPHYEIAQSARISEWRFSRLLNGRSEAAPAERERIAEVLNFEAGWLFETPNPPKPRLLKGGNHGSDGVRSEECDVQRHYSTQGDCRAEKGTL